jgi:hypothetical protein
VDDIQGNKRWRPIRFRKKINYVKNEFLIFFFFYLSGFGLIIILIKTRSVEIEIRAPYFLL